MFFISSNRILNIDLKCLFQMKTFMHLVLSTRNKDIDNVIMRDICAGVIQILYALWYYQEQLLWNNVCRKKKENRTKQLGTSTIHGTPEVGVFTFEQLVDLMDDRSNHNTDVIWHVSTIELDHIPCPWHLQEDTGACANCSGRHAHSQGGKSATRKHVTRQRDHTKLGNKITRN